MMHPLSLALIAACVTASSLLPRQNVQGTAVVNLSNRTGIPAHLASGFIYGIPEQPNQIPDHFFTDVGFNYGRAGGAHLPTPARGWIWGVKEYENRFKSALGNYQFSRRFNANFNFLIHDLWGADGTQNKSAPFPGDNGDWSSWDKFLTRWIRDMKANDALLGLTIDLWNEPDSDITFWNRTEQQYLQMWGRTWYRLRDELPGVMLTGPATASSPSSDNPWWRTFASFIATNQSIPDQWSWHMDSGKGDMRSAQAGLLAVLAEHKLPMRPININEYAVYDEQVPAGSAWWISQLERIDAIGLRENWQRGLPLHDFMAGLVSKPGAGAPSYDPKGGDYFPTGEFQVYKYYNLNMTGTRVGTLPTADMKMDAYAVVGVDKVRTLVGSRITAGTWEVTINDLSSVGLPEAGTLQVHTLGFPASTTDKHFGGVDGPLNMGTFPHPYTGNSVTFNVRQDDPTTAYAFEFDVVQINSGLP